jgi:PAS domain S-box-containing protein
MVFQGLALLLALACGGVLIAGRRSRKRLEATERALTASETRLRLAMKATGLGLWDYRPGQESVGSNDEVAQLLGYEPEAFSETRAAFVERLHPEDRGMVRACFRDYLEGRRKEYACEFRMRTRSGAYRWFRSVGQIVDRDGLGQASRVIGTYLDITDQVSAMRRLSELSAQLLTVQEEERRRHARELHDEIGQQLTAIKLNLHALGHDPMSGDASRRLTDCGAIVEHTLAQIRARVLDLRPPMLDDMGLGPALDWYCRRQEERAGICITLEGAEFLGRFAEPVEITAFRLVQEAVNNALQHGLADELAVCVRVEGDDLLVTVTDNGRGFDVLAPGGNGVGLSVMKERVLLVHGCFELTSDAVSGTRIHARLPLSGGGST